MSHEDIARRYPGVMKTTARFDARAVRDALLKRGGPDEAGFVRFAYRPFDNRWLYWEADTKLLDEKRADYRTHVFEGNVWLEAREREAKEDFSRGTLVYHLADNFGSGLSSFFPMWLREDGVVKANLKQARYAGEKTIQHYLERLGLEVEDLFYHVLATLHDPAYRQANAGALRMEWPRIPLPGWPTPGSAGIPGSGPGQALPAADAADALVQSAARGRQLAALLDSDTPVPGVTQAPLRPELAAIAVPATTDGRNMSGDDFAVTAGWGHFGTGDVVMPGQGRIVEHAYTADERATLPGATLASPLHDRATLDIYLNGNAFWCNVSAAVWNYRLGGYQVLKKWLSYRERAILDRPLRPGEVQHFSDTARRIATILLKT